MTGTGASVPRKHPDAASRVYGGDALIVLPGQSSFKILNTTGSRIWDLIDGSKTVEEIAEVIEREYDVTFDQALEDVCEFTSELEAHGMLASDSRGKVA